MSLENLERERPHASTDEKHALAHDAVLASATAAPKRAVQ